MLTHAGTRSAAESQTAAQLEHAKGSPPGAGLLAILAVYLQLEHAIRSPPGAGSLALLVVYYMLY